MGKAWIVYKGNQWDGMPWKPWQSDTINLEVSETLEKPGDFIYTYWESGNNCMETWLADYK